MIHQVEEEVDLEVMLEVEDLVEEKAVQVLQVDHMVPLLQVLHQVETIMTDQMEEEVGAKELDPEDRVVVQDNPGAEVKVVLEDHQEVEVEIQEEEGLLQSVRNMERHLEMEVLIVVEFLADIKEDLAEEDLLRD